jgi:hypothetical protein
MQSRQNQHGLLNTTTAVSMTFISFPSSKKLLLFILITLSRSIPKKPPVLVLFFRGRDGVASVQVSGQKNQAFVGHLFLRHA